ncbi:MAG: hypothetical protein AAGI11_13445 [Pseudomonadota bacterium]
MAQAVIRGYLEALRSHLQRPEPSEELPLASQTEEVIAADCTRFTLQCSGRLLSSSNQAYRAGYDFYQSRTGSNQAFPVEAWPGKRAAALAHIAEKFEYFQAVEGDDGLLYVA